jgi:hypothetical protein
VWGDQVGGERKETKNFPEGNVEENEIFRSLHLNKMETREGGGMTRAL